MSVIRVSVVIPTYRRPDLLKRCLEALLAQDYDARMYEVIVVDDAADECTRALVEQVQRGCCAAGQRRGADPAVLGPAGQERPAAHVPDQDTHPLPRISYIAFDGRGPAAARNRGWQAACGEVIAFTDDDCIPAPTWLKCGTQALSSGAAGAGGRVIVPISAQPTDFELDATGLERSRFVTANCFYRRSALSAVGGFDEAFTLPWREDSDLYFRLLKRDCRLVEAPEALVIHPVRPAPWGVSVRQQRKSMFNALIYKKHPDLYPTLQPSPPWGYYAIAAAMLAAVIGLANENPALALGGGILWAGQTLGFAHSRLRRTRRTFSHVLEMLATSAVIPLLCLFWRWWGAIKYRVLFL